MSTKPVYMMDFVERAEEIMRLKMELAEAHEGIMRLNDWQNGTGIPAVDAVARVRELCDYWAQPNRPGIISVTAILRALEQE